MLVFLALLIKIFKILGMSSQVEMVTLEELIPSDHIYKKIQRIMGFY
jgi:hypothetical protein